MAIRPSCSDVSFYLKKRPWIVLLSPIMSKQKHVTFLCYYLAFQENQNNFNVRQFVKTVMLPVVLYGCETWPFVLREERRLRVFGKRILRRIFRPSRSRWSRGNVLASRSKARGFKPGWVRLIISGPKNPEHKSSGRDFKPWVWVCEI